MPPHGRRPVTIVSSQPYSALCSAHLHPAPLRMRGDRRIDHALRLVAIVKAWRAWAVLQDRVDELTITR
jgi:hypothetical protein